MGYRVVTAPPYDERFETAIQFRIDYFGARSASKLIDEQERIQGLLSDNSLMGTLVDKNDDGTSPDALRWVLVEKYACVYRVHLGDESVVLEDLFYSTEDWRDRMSGQQAD